MKALLCLIGQLLSSALLVLAALVFGAGIVVGVIGVVLLVMAGVPEPLAPGLGGTGIVILVIAGALLAAAILLFLVAGAIAIGLAFSGCPSGVSTAGAGFLMGNNTSSGLSLPGFPFPLPGALPGIDWRKLLTCLAASSSSCECAGKGAPDPKQVWDGLWSQLQNGLRVMDGLKTDAEEKRKAIQAFIDQAGGQVTQQTKDALKAAEGEAQALDNQRQQLLATGGQLIASAPRPHL